jgi:hypothetical protein
MLSGFLKLFDCEKRDVAAIVPAEPKESLYLQPQSQQQASASKTYRGVEQLVARWAHNPKVVSSSLAPATKNPVSRKGWRDFFFEE